MRRPCWPTQDKKSGGKDGSAKARLLQKWDRRYFVLGTSATAVYYYKTDAAYRKKEEPQGSLELRGGSAFLKEVGAPCMRAPYMRAPCGLSMRAATSAAPRLHTFSMEAMASCRGRRAYERTSR